MGINLPHGGCKWEGCNVCANIRIGYHRVSENSVTSAVLTKAELQERVEEIPGGAARDSLAVGVAGGQGRGHGFLSRRSSFAGSVGVPLFVVKAVLLA